MQLCCCGNVILAPPLSSVNRNNLFISASFQIEAVPSQCSGKGQNREVSKRNLVMCQLARLLLATVSHPLGNCWHQTSIFAHSGEKKTHSTATWTAQFTPKKDLCNAYLNKAHFRKACWTFDGKGGTASEKIGSTACTAKGK